VFVYVSSLAVAGPHREAVTEPVSCHPVSLYGQSKLEAEQVLQQRAHELPVTVVRPPCVFGPGDRNLLSLFRSVRRGWNVYSNPNFQYSFLHVDDLVTALVAAASHGQRLATHADSSRRGVYFVSDRQAVTFPELGELVAECLQRDHIRQVRIPSVVGWTAAGAGQLVQRIFRRRVFLNLDKAREAYGGSWMCDPTRAEQQLQFHPPQRLAQRLSETAVSYRQTGWL
jgi:nucleoside-diphosphate-sugar epimerase